VWLSKFQELILNVLNLFL
jgi:hypothetical protein